jgi:hypothetical protein
MARVIPPAIGKPVMAVGPHLSHERMAAVSSKQALVFRDRLLWARTETLMVWLGHLVETSGEVAGTDEAWFGDLLRDWREQSFIGDVGCTMEDSWTDDQLAQVVELAKRGRGLLHTEPPPSYLRSPDWSVHNHDRVAGGGRPEPLIELLDQLADAFTLLLEGRLPPDPNDGAWVVGFRPGEWSAIYRR